MEMEATFGAGCFWGVEETFRALPGVLMTEVGFMGGKTKDPSYYDVCNGGTDHAEVVHLKFDPEEVSYEKLLDIFWNNHNPTQFNRQGPDIGSQYRSVIFYYNDEQREIAEKSKADLAASGKFKNAIVTLIQPAQPFYRAEDYHQQYFLKRGGGSCHL